MRKTIIFKNSFNSEEKNKISFSQDIFIKDLPSQVRNSLINNDQIIFRIVSWSMFPIIWAGDTVKIDTIKPEETKLGDIILYKNGDYLYIHRLINKYISEGKLYIETTDEQSYRKNKFVNRPQCKNHASAITAECILGKAVKIKRGGKYLNPESIELNSWQMFYGKLRLWIWKIKQKLILTGGTVNKSLVNALLSMQKISFYREQLKKSICSKTYFFIGMQIFKSRGENHNFENYIKLEDFQQENLSWDNNTYNLSARINLNPVGNINLALENSTGYKICSLSDFVVRIRFRGAGIGFQLAEKAVNWCEQIKAEEIKVTLSEKDETAVKIFRKLGFIAAE